MVALGMLHMDVGQESHDQYEKVSKQLNIHTKELDI